MTFASGDIIEFVNLDNMIGLVISIEHELVKIIWFESGIYRNPLEYKSHSLQEGINEGLLVHQCC